MKPSPSYALIIEDIKQDQTSFGLVLSHQTKYVNSVGTVYAIDGKCPCPHCHAQFTRDDIKEGDRVIYSKFIAENIDYKTPDMPEGRLMAVPIDAILAIIS